jgi:hypothetical protein
MPLSVTDRPAICDAIRSLIREFEACLSPGASVPESFGDKSDPDRARRYRTMRVLQAGESIRRLLLPSMVRDDGSVMWDLPGEIDQFPDITDSQFGISEKAELKELVDFCKQPHLQYEGLRRPEQAILYLVGVWKKLGGDKLRRPEGRKVKRARGRKPDTDPKADKRVADAWATGEHKTYEDCGRALKMTRKQVKDAIDRHRHRTRGKRRRRAPAPE